MADRFPDYDVLAKRDSPSWNSQTREVIDERLALTLHDDVLPPSALATLVALVDHVVPQPAARPPVNTAAILLDRIANDSGDGFRREGMPRFAEAWRRGLVAIGDEADLRYGRPFPALDAGEARALLVAVERGTTASPRWGGLPPALFWSWRLLPDIVSAYYAHPSAWSAIGFGGPAAPRGYVRLQADRRDPWEAAETGDGALLPARLRNRHAR